MTAPYTKDSAYDIHRVTTFRHRISRAAGARHPPEHGRYHLYAMIGCPWAQRVLIVRELKGLQRAISVSFVHHHMVEEQGWAFAAQTPDPLYGLRYLRELYAMADARFAGRPTVPVLWDKLHETIVNNESAELVRMLGGEFNAFADNPALDLYPAALRPRIDAWNAALNRDVSRGIYGVLFATTPQERDSAVARFFAALASLDKHLAHHRFLLGDAPTEADWLVLPALIRFEWVYRTLARLEAHSLASYAHLLAYTRELCQWPGIANTLDRALTREAYFSSMLRLNPSGMVPPYTGVDFGQTGDSSNTVVADVQEKRGAKTETATSLSAH
jgi:glutathionyl-hydroquinone reductase